MAKSRPTLRAYQAILAVALISISVMSNNSARSAEPQWPAQPYKYMVIDQDIRDVLIEFGRNIGVHTKISDAVAGRRVRGEFTIVGAREFLQRLCGGYGLVWYFDGSVLHVNAESEIRTELIPLMAVRADSLEARLTALGVSDARYPIRTTGNAGVVSVSGPPPFLTLVRQTVAAMEKALAPPSMREVTDGDEKRVRIFRGNQGS